MADEHTVTFTYKLINNVSETAEKISQDVGSAGKIVEETTEKEKTLSVEVDKTNAKLSNQQDVLLKQVVGFLAIGRSVSMISSSLKTMGLISDETALKLQKIVAGFQLINGMVTGLKALQLVAKTLQSTEAGTAVIETYRAVLSNPLKTALVGAAIGASVGIATYSFMSGSNTSSETGDVTINFNTNEERNFGNDVEHVVIR